MITIVNNSKREMIQQYNDYLTDHINNVMKTWNIMLKNVVRDLEDITVDTISISRTILKHDKSKYLTDEFEPYLIHFYSEEGKTKSAEDNFDKAWLNHIHRNCHHWQHWILQRDSGESVALDMPFEYIMEMLCDWHSFSAKNPESTAYNWYQKNKSKMKLSDNTRKVVETYIEYLKTPL